MELQAGITILHTHIYIMFVIFGIYTVKEKLRTGNLHGKEKFRFVELHGKQKFV